ncbi:MAG TPA: AAA family ATPase, partial [Actinomycetota bacterium]|nr:AAA family ATPase [Actinomycetota bacterium]
LAAELAREVLGAGWVVLYGRCDEDAVVPYQPFVEVLRNLLASEMGRALPTPGQWAELARLVPEVAGPAVPLAASGDPESDRYRFFEAVSSVLAAASRRHPVLLVLDDLHWATKPTLLLLRHLVQASESTPLLVLGTYREGELSRTHPLTDLLMTLRQEGLHERIALRGLTPFEVTTLLEQRAGRDLTPDAVALSENLSQATAGNPFFILEILRHLAESGGIAVREGRWVTPGVRDLEIPEGVRDVIGRRLSRLSEAANTALAHAAVLGREFEFDVLAAMAGLDDDTLLSAVEEALAASLIAEAPGAVVSTYFFIQILVREALLTELSRARRERMHLRAARAIEAVYPGRTDAKAGALALHYRLASRPGVPEKAIEYSVKAGEAAARALAWEEVVSHWKAALQLMEEEGEDPHRRAVLLERLAELMYVAGFDLVLGIAYSENALALYEELCQQEAAARMHSRLGHYLATFPQTMDIPRALRHFVAAEAAMGDGPPSAALGYVCVGHGAAGWWGMRSEEGLIAHHRAAEIGEALGQEALRASGAGGEGWHRAVRGALADGKEAVGRTWEIGDQLNHRFLAFYGAWGRGVLGLLVLDPGDAASWFERELARSRLAQAPMQRRLLEGELASARLLAGRVEEARRLPEANGFSVFVPPVAFFDGDWEGALAALGAASEWAVQTGNRWHQWALDRAAAQVCRVSGQGHRAVDLLEEALALALESGYVVVEAGLRADLVVACVEAGDTAEARRHLVRARELLTADEDWRGIVGRLALAEAVAGADEGRQEPSEDYFRTAASVFSRYELPWDEAETLLLWGRTLAGVGQLGRAQERFGASDQVYRRCGVGERWLARLRAG